MPKHNPDLAFARVNAALAARYLRRLPPERETHHIPLADIVKRSKLTEARVLKALDRTTAWAWRTVLIEDGVWDPELYLIYRPLSGWDGVMKLWPSLIILSGPSDRAAANLACGTLLKNWQPDRLTLEKVAQLCGLVGKERNGHRCRLFPTMKLALDRLVEIDVLEPYLIHAGKVRLTWPLAGTKAPRSRHGAFGEHFWDEREHFVPDHLAS